MERCPAAPKNTRAMSSRCEVDLRPRSRSACSNRRIRARTGMARRSAGGAAPGLEQPAQHRREVERLDVASREAVEQHLHALLGRQGALDEDDLLAVHAAAAAPYAVAHLAQQLLLAHLDAQTDGHLLQLLAQRLVTPAHAVVLSDGRGFAKGGRR